MTDRPKQTVAILALIACCLSFTLSSASKSTAADFYVSQKGADDNPGTQEKPFATLERARNAVRELKSKIKDRNITVFIGGDEYYLPNGLEFTAQDSGNDKQKIAYMGDEKNPPVLIGGLAIDGWQPYEKDVYVANIPEGVSPKQVFENRERMTLARTPDEGYFKIEDNGPNADKLSFIYRKGELDPTGWDLTNAALSIWPNHDWFNSRYPLVNINPKSRTVTADAKPAKLRPGNRYFIENVLALLDRPGECQIDLANRKIYIKPKTKSFNAGQFVISTANSILSIDGDGDRPVKNLHFENVDFSIANRHAVALNDAEDCSIRFGQIENANECGVAVSNRAQRNTLYGNEIRYHGLHGVQISGHGPGGPDVSFENIVENNHIHHCGRLVGHGYGVRLSGSGRNRVVHNHIHHMPRYALTVKGTRLQILKERFPDANLENQFELRHASGNLFAYNHIHHVNLESQDTGAIESWGEGQTTIDHNLIHDVGNNEFDIESGIYLDDNVDRCTVTNNIIYNVVGTKGNQCIYTKGVGNRIENNVLVVGPKCRSAIRSFFMADERCDNHAYKRNIVVFENPEASIYDFNNWSDDRVSQSNSNVFWNPKGTLNMKGGPADKSYEKWTKLFDGKFDGDSITEDPMFVDAANRDYRLKPDSPALKLGVESIDTSEIGLKSDYPNRLEKQ